MRVKGGFIWVEAIEEYEGGFWLRASDVVGVKPNAETCKLMRHATMPIEVLGREEEVLDALNEADGRAVKQLVSAAQDTD